MCNQQSLRSACAYTNSRNVKLQTEHHLEFLRLNDQGCIGASESTQVKCHIVGNHMPWLILLFAQITSEPSIDKMGHPELIVSNIMAIPKGLMIFFFQDNSLCK